MKNFSKRFLALILSLSTTLPLAACIGTPTGDGKDDSKANISIEESAPQDTTVTGGKLKTEYNVDENAPTLRGDVVLIQLNDIAAFAVDYGAMPALKAFGDKAVLYPDFYAQRNRAEGMYSALTSLYAPIEGIKDSAKYYTLAHLFKENGYNTSAILQNGEEYISEALGIDTVKTVETAGSALNSVIEATKNSRDDFMFVEFAPMEYPYIPDSEGLADLEGNKYLASYLECAAYADTLLKSLFDALEELGTLAPTVIIYGTAPVLDKDYGKYGEDYPQMFKDGFDSDDAYRTPFIISAPGLEAAKADSFATVYDIYPTTAALFGFKSDKMLISGDNVYMNSALPKAMEPIAAQVNLAKGKTYSFAPADGSEAAYMFPSLGDDGKMLTNGVITDGKNVPESGCGFVLKQCSKEHYITVDLGEEKSFDRIDLAGVAYKDPTYTGLKDDSFTAKYSKDGKTFVATKGNCTYETDEGGVFRTYTLYLEEAVTARYVQVSVSSTGNYLTASEIMVYGTLSKDVLSADGLRFFAIQGDYCKRGELITSALLYDGTEEIHGATSTGAAVGVSARPYRGWYTHAMTTILESEYAVRNGYYEGGMTYKELHDKLPGLTRLVKSVKKDVHGSGNMVGHYGHLSNYSLSFSAPSLDGVWEGLKCENGKIVLAEGATEGTLMVKEFDLGLFSNLYVLADGKTNGGKIELYVSYTMDNGVSTRFEKAFAYDDGGFTDGLGSIGALTADGKDGESKRFRVMIRLVRSDGDSPALEMLTVTPVPKAGKTEAPDKIEEAVEVSLTLPEKAEYDSGVIAVETLVAKALSTEPDFEKATNYVIGDDETVAFTQMAPYAKYAREMGLSAFVDGYSTKEMMAALDYGQPVIFRFGGNVVIATGYKATGFTVLDVAEGGTKTIGFDKINNTEVLIVDSTLSTPQIIDNFIAENSAVRPGEVTDKKYIVIHNTGNYNSSATAKAHDSYIQGLESSPDRKVSWHYTVDDVEIYHHLPDNETAWHAGDGSQGDGNRLGIGIEICVNNFPGVYEGEAYELWLKQFTKAVKNAAYLTAKLMIENDIAIDCVKQHYDFAPEKKNCPMQMRYTSGSGTFTRDEGDMWVYFMSQVEKQFARLNTEVNE